MIKIELNPTRIQRVTIEARSKIERDFDTAALVLIQPILRQLTANLRGK